MIIVVVLLLLLWVIVYNIAISLGFEPVTAALIATAFVVLAVAIIK